MPSDAEWIPKPLVVLAFIDPPSWGIVTEVGTVHPTLICEVPNSPDAKRYADLFAAAPDLYAALSLYVEHFGDPLKVGRAALAKARGESE